MKNGVPWATVFGTGPTELDEVERMAFAIIFKRLEGNVFDWTTGRWKDR